MIKCVFIPLQRIVQEACCREPLYLFGQTLQALDSLKEEHANGNSQIELHGLASVLGCAGFLIIIIITFILFSATSNIVHRALQLHYMCNSFHCSASYKRLVVEPFLFGQTLQALGLKEEHANAIVG